MTGYNKEFPSESIELPSNYEKLLIDNMLVNRMDDEEKNEEIFEHEAVEKREPQQAGSTRGPPEPAGFVRITHRRLGTGDIRSRLLNRLGIEKEIGIPLSASAAAAAPGATVQTQASRVTEQGKVDAFTVALKADYGLPDRLLESKPVDSIEALSTSPGSDSKVLEKNVNKGVCFDASVQVHPIPSRSAYSKRIHSVLWTPPSEIAENAARNSLEFAAEDWDVTKVVDDEDMVVYGGERIHPIHFVQDIDHHFMEQNEMKNEQEEEQ
jgi:hypothetical protein